MIYNISDRTLKTIEKQEQVGDSAYKDVFELLDYLSKSNLSNKVIDSTARFLHSIEDKELKELYKAMILKNLRIGVSTKTINKVYSEYGEGDLIPYFEVMRAEKFEGRENLFKDNREFAVTPKLDGVRGIAIIDPQGNISLKTRQNKPILGLKQVESDLAKLPKSYVYDGELLCVDDINKSIDEVYRITAGIINNKDEIKEGIYFHVFDMIDYGEFISDSCTETYSQRRDRLEKVIENLEYVKVVPTLYQGNDVKTMQDITRKLVEKNLEGSMVNFLDGVYECKRSRNILKVKPTYSVDLRIVDVEEGKASGKYKGKLGALIVDYKGSRVGVGTGFSDDDREYLWNNREDIIGKIVEIEHKGETTNKVTNEPSLNYATFIRLREDKDEVSYN